MKILNLYAGAGGNRKLWSDKHEITAVELDPNIAGIYSHFFPKDTVIVADAHQYLLDHFKEFDFIWSSPPCPTHSRLMTAKTGWGIYEYPDMRLWQEIIFLKYFFKGYFAIENVISYYDPFIKPTATLARHYFWTNFPLKEYSGENISYYKTRDVSREKKESLSQKYNIHLPTGTKNERKILRNMVIPELGKHIFDCASNFNPTLL